MKKKTTKTKKPKQSQESKMLKYEKKNYFHISVAILIILAVATAFIVYFLTASDKNFNNVKLSPPQNTDSFPKTAPSVPLPTTPPPAR